MAQHQQQITKAVTRRSESKEEEQSTPQSSGTNQASADAQVILAEVDAVLAEVEVIDDVFRSEPSGADSASWWQWYRLHQEAIDASGWLPGCHEWEHTDGSRRAYRA